MELGSWGGGENLKGVGRGGKCNQNVLYKKKPFVSIKKII